jgi:signal transduction histidine kinase
LLRPILSTSIELHLELSDSTQEVYADADTLSQVVTNLVINARDAVVERGAAARIGIHTSQVLLDTPQHGLEPGSYACVAVHDNGCGMSPEVQERAFEPFFTTKRVGSGTGLGLSMIYGVARDHGGAVTIESEPGSGTRVSVLLPRVVPELT